MNISKLSKDPRAIKALTGLSYQEFADLIPVFAKSLIEIKMQNPNRQRKVGGGQKGHLKTTADKLFYILFYLKTYPTFDVLAFFTNKSRGRTCEAAHLYLKVIKKSLGRELVLPKRKISSVEEFFEAFPEAKDIFLDGTERKIQRPKNKKKQNKLYSGKKKMTARKNIIISDQNKRIMFLSKTKSGRRHDKKLYDKSEIHIPDKVAIWADSGLQGIQKTHPNVCMPKKGTKKNPLTKREKENNRIISSFRIVVEHAIAGIKRYRVVTDTFRNKKPNLDDLFMEISSGLWNLHLRYTS